MNLFSLAVFYLLNAAFASAISRTQEASRKIIRRPGDELFKRQIPTCSGPGSTCQSQCGATFRSCHGGIECYDTTSKYMCCDSGFICWSGDTYCAKNPTYHYGCCKKDWSESKCDAMHKAAETSAYPESPDNGTSDDDWTSTHHYVYYIAGAVIVLLIIGVLVWCCVRRRRRARSATQGGMAPPAQFYQTPTRYDPATGQFQPVSGQYQPKPGQFYQIRETSYN